MRRGIHGAYTVAAFVLLALVIIVAVTVFLSVRDVYEHTEEDARCASQIRVHAAAAQTTSDLKSLKVVCPSQRISVGPGDDAREEVASAMRRCWDMWGRGELQLFGKEEGAYCHVCSLITVPSGEPITGLPEYLSSEKTRGGLTYTEYLAGVKRGEAFVDAQNPDPADLSIPTDKPVGVVFYYAKGQDFWDSAKNAVIGEPPRATAVGAVGGAAIVGGAALYIAAAIGTGGLSIVATGAIAITAGAATGAGAGFITSLVGREDLDSLSMVLVRPLAEEDVRLLGCTFAPVANE